VSFRDLNIKKCYDSDIDDILNDFYIPALSNSIKYQRLAGFFSSSSLAIAAKGIAGFIANNGKMQLICSAKLEKRDVEAILEGTTTPVDIIEKQVLWDLDNINNLENEFVTDRVKALGWMIANKLLEIKVAIVIDTNGKFLDYNEVEQSGIFHQKVGILYDDEGNLISFSGSDNETASGWTRNVEEFKVFMSFDEYQKDYLKADRDRFLKFWHGLANRTEVIDVPKAVKHKLIEIAPKDIKDLKLDKYGSGKRKKGFTLWSHQIDAIDKWDRNNKRCIFEMATGTGKTLSALGCLKKIVSEETKLLTIICCPNNQLITQWVGDYERSNIRVEFIIADSSNPKWKHQITDYIRDINNNVEDKLTVFTSHDSYYTPDFIEIINNFKHKIFIIADEVHGLGSEERKIGLQEQYQYRLGLSATPNRWFDPEGTAKLLSYFNVTKPEDAYTFSLEEAIKSINPSTGETYLTPYEYRPRFLSLTEDEIDEYVIQSKKIAKAYHASKNSEERLKNYNLLCIQRQNIIRNAMNKYNAFENILSEIDELKHCLVYCSPEQIDDVQHILNKRGIIQHSFTQEESTTPSDKFNGVSQRDFILKHFASGSYQALVAIRCLDEGIDVPQAKIGIILASTGNPRQYIQRRGRLLRRAPGKDIAIIYDLIVFPSLGNKLPDELVEIEKKILVRELIRYEEFVKISHNVIECIKKLQEIEEELEINI